MGKVEIGIYFCATADILTKVLQKCSWSRRSSTNHMNFVQITDFDGGHGNRKAKFSKLIFKNPLLRSHKGMKLKLCIHVYDISLYINCVFLLLLLKCFRCYGNLGFP